MAHRTFRDEHGREWDAWDVVPTTVERRSKQSSTIVPNSSADRRTHAEARVVVPETLEKGWLAFQCGTERRRLTPIPPGWDEMTVAELIELLRRASARGRARRLIE